MVISRLWQCSRGVDIQW